MHNHLAVQFKEFLLIRLRESKVSGLIINLSNIDVVDSFMGRTIGEIADSAVLLGVQVVIVGLRPEVAITLVEMGLSLGQVHPVLNLELALEFLRSLRSS